MAWTYPLMTAISAVARRRGLRGPKSATATLNGHRALDWALAAAWDTAGPGGRARIIELQLARRTPAAAESLVTQFHGLDPEARTALLGRVDDLYPALRQLLDRSAPAVDTPKAARIADAQTSINALWLIEHGNAGTLAYLAVPRLRDPDPAVRDAAAACLVGLADGRHRAAATAEDAPDAGPDPYALAAIAESLDRAVVHYASHLNPAAIEAWVAQGPAAFGPESPALAALNDPEHPAVPALRGLLKDASGSAIRRGLVPLLGLPTLALAAVAGLRKTAEEGPDALATVLHGQAHLLDLPAVRHGLSRGGVPDSLWPAGLGTGGAQAACDALPAWAAALPGTAQETLARLGPLTADGPVTRRLDALRRALHLAHPTDAVAAQHTRLPAFRHALHAVLAPLRADPDPRLAAPAAAYLLRDRPAAAAPRRSAGHRFNAPGPPIAPTRTDQRATQPSVARCRRAASRRVAANAFEPLWHAWSRLPSKQRRRAAAAALRLDPTARQRLRYATNAHDSTVRFQAQVILDAATAVPGLPAVSSPGAAT